MVYKYSSVDQLSYIKYILLLVQTLFKRRYFIKLLFIRIIKNRFKDSFLGILWSLLSPMISMIAIAIIFPLIMKFKVENYVVYLFSGFLGWHLISSSITNGGSSILSRAGLLKKYNIPKIIFPVTVSLVEVFNFMITFFALLLVLLILEYEYTINLSYLTLTFFVTYIFALSLSIISSVVFVYFRDLQHLISIFMQALFYLTPIIYLVSIIPERYMVFMNLNIFYHYINLFHGSIYDDRIITYNSFLVPSLISLTSLVISLIIFKKLEKNLIYRF